MPTADTMTTHVLSNGLPRADGISRNGTLSNGCVKSDHVNKCFQEDLRRTAASYSSDRPVQPSATELYREKSSVAYELSKLSLKAPRPVKVIVIGAGVSALSLAHDVHIGRLPGVELHILEKNAGLGGTWFENRYPGCACDVPSHNYQVMI